MSNGNAHEERKAAEAISVSIPGMRLLQLEWPAAAPMLAPGEGADSQRNPEHVPGHKQDSGQA
jgi:hypothetical protein